MVYFQEHRILLTGTPLQNNVDELFSLLNFLEPAQFPSQVAFLMEFGDLKTEAQVEKLKQVCWCWYFVYSLWYSHGFLILFFFCSSLDITNLFYCMLRNIFDHWFSYRIPLFTCLCNFFAILIWHWKRGLWKKTRVKLHRVDLTNVQLYRKLKFCNIWLVLLFVKCYSSHVNISVDLLIGMEPLFTANAGTGIAMQEVPRKCAKKQELVLP